MSEVFSSPHEKCVVGRWQWAQGVEVSWSGTDKIQNTSNLKQNEKFEERKIYNITVKAKRWLIHD